MYSTHRENQICNLTLIFEQYREKFYEVDMRFKFLVQTLKFSNYASIALTATQPLLSASIPTEPVPLYRSSHRPDGKLAEHPPNA
jgi:hypothetical protein